MKIIKIPGSKSLTNRALIIGSIAGGISTIENFSKCDDSMVLIKALQKLGVKITVFGNKLTVVGNGGKFKHFKGILDVKEAGTALRFLTALTHFVPGKVTFKGSKRLMERPIKDLKRSLAGLGTGKITIKGDISSQFISAILMVSPLVRKGLTIKVAGDLVSKSYVDMTIDIMKKFGVKVKNDHYKKLVVGKNQSYEAIDYLVESDASGASYFWAIAAVTGKAIRVTNVDPVSSQGDVKFPDLLEKMGCLVRKNIEKKWIEVKGPRQLQGIRADMSLMPDTAQTLAVVAAFSKGVTVITGLGTLKVKETDRLAALKNELGKIGIKSSVTTDSIMVMGGCPKKAVVETYGDHRMAMAFAVANAKVPGLEIKNSSVVSKSFPEFWTQFRQVL